MKKKHIRGVGFPVGCRFFLLIHTHTHTGCARCEQLREGSVLFSLTQFEGFASEVLFSLRARKYNDRINLWTLPIGLILSPNNQFLVFLLHTRITF